MTDTSLIIEGGNRIQGEIKVSGAKNASLPILSATLLCEGTSVLHNCPALSDVYSCCRILTSLGASCHRDGDTLSVNTADITDCEIGESLMRKMRSSIVFLGAILSRLGRCRLSFPGGCELGARPIDIHLSALRKMGAKISEEHGVLDCTLPSGVESCRLVLPFPSVGATENIMLLEARSQATDTVINTARDTEIVELHNYNNACGGKIIGAGTETVTVCGVARLHPCEYSVMPDRIVAGTYLGAAAITGGEVLLNGANQSHMHAILSAYEQAGCSVYSYDDKIYLSARAPLKPIKSLKTLPYPGFPTDCQPILMAVLTKAKGTSVISENIFENRYRAAPELSRMGADIKTEGRIAVIHGRSSLWGAGVYAPDLRAGVALVLAGLAAEGVTTVGDIHYIDRGYEAIERDLSLLGANIKRK